MNLEKKHISTKQRIGHLDDADVFHIATSGGLHMVVAVQKDKGTYRTLGAGPHIGIARFLAEKAEPNMVVDKLLKSDSLSIHEMAEYLPDARVLTRKLQGEYPGQWQTLFGK